MVRGARKIKLREQVKSVKILPTGTQFNGASPTNITLKALAVGFTPVTYEWYKGTGMNVVGTTQNFIVANNQVSTLETYHVVVKDNKGQAFDDLITITKVVDGNQGIPGQLPVQREWKTGDVYRNNEYVIDYIYHRATNTWWRLKDGYNNVTAQINPTIEFIQLNSLEKLAVNLLIAENANIAGFVFKDGKMVSQNPSTANPNLVLDGINGFLKALAGQIGLFEIHDGLQFNQTGSRVVEGLSYPYQKFFGIDDKGFKLVNDDIYYGYFCFEDALGFPYCSIKNNHRVKWEVATGNEDYALKVFMEGAYKDSYKGAIWLSAASSGQSAILVEKGGINLKKGDFRVNGRIFLNQDLNLSEGFISFNTVALATAEDDFNVTSQGEIMCKNYGKPIIVKLPSNPNPGRKICIKRVAPDKVTIDANGKQLVRAGQIGTTFEIETRGDMMSLVFDGDHWQMNKMGI